MLGDLTLAVQRADLGDRGIFYRVRSGPFPNRATAQDLCAQIEAAKLACLVVRDKWADRRRPGTPIPWDPHTRACARN